MAKKSNPAPQAPHMWTVIFSSLAVIISLGGLFLSWANYRQTQKINRKHVKPDVICMVRHTTLPRWTNSPYAAELVVFNRGPIRASSVYVAYQTWVVNTNYWWPFSNPRIVQSLTTNFAFVTPELDVGEGRIKSLLSVGPMAVYEVVISYSRPTDMESFTHKAMFFYQDGHFYDQVAFQQRPFYGHLMQNLERRKAGKAGILPPGKLAPLEGESISDYNFFVPDDNESPRPVQPVDFHRHF